MGKRRRFRLLRFRLLKQTLPLVRLCRLAKGCPNEEFQTASAHAIHLKVIKSSVESVKKWLSKLLAIGCKRLAEAMNIDGEETTTIDAEEFRTASAQFRSAVSCVKDWRQKSRWETLREKQPTSQDMLAVMADAHQITRAAFILCKLRFLICGRRLLSKRVPRSDIFCVGDGGCRL